MILTSSDLELVLFVANHNPMMGPSDPVPFEDVLVNHGGHYDDVTHQVTIPEDGLYLTRWAVFSIIPLGYKYLGYIQN